MTGIIILIGSIFSVVAVAYGSKIWGGKKYVVYHLNIWIKFETFQWDSRIK
jgi:hypothetical protein